MIVYIYDYRIGELTSSVSKSFEFSEFVSLFLNYSIIQFGNKIMSLQPRPLKNYQDSRKIGCSLYDIQSLQQSFSRQQRIRQQLQSECHDLQLTLLSFLPSQQPSPSQQPLTPFQQLAQHQCTVYRNLLLTQQKQTLNSIVRSSGNFIINQRQLARREYYRKEKKYQRLAKKAVRCATSPELQLEEEEIPRRINQEQQKRKLAWREVMAKRKELKALPEVLEGRTKGLQEELSRQTVGLGKELNKFKALKDEYQKLMLIKSKTDYLQKRIYNFQQRIEFERFKASTLVNCTELSQEQLHEIGRNLMGKNLQAIKQEIQALGTSKQISEISSKIGQRTFYPHIMDVQLQAAPFSFTRQQNQLKFNLILYLFSYNLHSKSPSAHLRQRFKRFIMAYCPQN